MSLTFAKELSMFEKKSKNPILWMQAVMKMTFVVLVKSNQLMKMFWPPPPPMTIDVVK